MAHTPPDPAQAPPSPPGSWAKRFELRPIAFARQAAPRRDLAPAQGRVAAAAAPAAAGAASTCFLEVAPPYRAGLADLAGFSRVWVVYVFDRNAGWRAKVRPPRGGPARGVFATRAPHRPNALGLTCATLLEVALSGLWLGESDLLEGTPVVDLKPYLPQVDAHPDADAGWTRGDLPPGRLG